MKKENLEDILGPAKTKVKKVKVDDILGPKPKTKVKKTVAEAPKPKVKKTKVKKKKDYEALEKPRHPVKAGLFAAKAALGEKLGVKCLECGDPLKYKSGRPPILCRKQSCFRAYRNQYRRDYQKAHAA